jgi:hypothetical protein
MGVASRYVPRAPRYIYRPQDQRLMRYKPMEILASSVRAQARDVSTSGISFVVPPGEAPFEGEILKIEWVLPGGKQLAWFASVVRIESRIDWDPRGGDVAQTIVALRFHQVSPLLTKAIQKSLAPHVGKEESVRDEIAYDLNSLTRKQIAAFSSLLVGVTAAFILMAVPMELWLRPFRSLFY